VRPFATKPSAFKWLYPGMKVKRWLLLLLLGTTVLSLGFAYSLREIYDVWAFPHVFYYLFLQFVPRWWRALLFAVAGLTAVIVAVVQLNQSLLAAFLTPGRDNVVDIVYRHRFQKGRGPKIAALGGGTGLATLLRGLKSYTSNISAIVTVADDGGSSGRIREELGMLPPGDFRSCIAALADDESLVAQLFQYRFGGEKELGGHSFGNLFIAAMAAVTGNFERAILESSRVLAVSGRILPSTLDNVILCAEVVDTGSSDKVVSLVQGESRIPSQNRVIGRVFLQPDGVRAYPGALRAILDADLVVIGPGSLYTSVIPNLCIDEIAKAIQVTPAPKVYICNVATQLGETEHFTVEDHIQAVQRYIGNTYLHVLINDNLSVDVPDQWSVDLVARGETELQDDHVVAIYEADVIDRNNPWRHDSLKLAERLIRIYELLKANRANERTVA